MKSNGLIWRNVYQNFQRQGYTRMNDALDDGSNAFDGSSSNAIDGSNKCFRSMVQMLSTAQATPQSMVQMLAIVVSTAHFYQVAETAGGSTRTPSLSVHHIRAASTCMERRAAVSPATLATRPSPSGRRQRSTTQTSVASPALVRTVVCTKEHTSPTLRSTVMTKSPVQTSPQRSCAREAVATAMSSQSAWTSRGLNKYSLTYRLRSVAFSNCEFNISRTRVFSKFLKTWFAIYLTDRCFLSVTKQLRSLPVFLIWSGRWNM